MASVERDGVAVTLPPGWEGRAYRRNDQAEPAGLAPAAGELYPIVVQAATFALPPDTADYGGGAVEVMGRSDIFVTLVEHPGAAHEALFAAEGVPRQMAADDFDPNVLQRGISGQSGAQRFFRVADRAFGLYIVLGSHALRGMLAREANRLLAGIEVS